MCIRDRHADPPAESRQRRQSKKSVQLPPWWPQQLEPLPAGDTLYGVEPRWMPLVSQLMKHLDVILPGVEVATVKGRDFIPAQGVAMLPECYLPDGVTRVEVDEPTALTYLRREAITLPDGTPRGFVLLTFAGSPLGWVKNIGNRSNNLYPLPWRIRHL